MVCRVGGCVHACRPVCVYMYFLMSFQRTRQKARNFEVHRFMIFTLLYLFSYKL